MQYFFLFCLFIMDLTKDKNCVFDINLSNSNESDSDSFSDNETYISDEGDNTSYSNSDNITNHYSYSEDEINSKKFQNSFAKKLLSQLAEINKINISPKETDDTTSKKENLLEFEKNDQLISRSDSEFRLFVILGILSIIENLVLLIITIFLSQINQSNLIDVDIQVQFPQPHLKAIYRNGSVYSSYFKEGSFVTSEYEFDLPANADYYFYFEYRQRNSYIHGNGYQNNFHQTFKSVRGKGRQRKHTFSSKFGKELWFDGPYMKSGHNSSIVQIGNTLMLFGGGKDKKSDGKVFQSSTFFS